MPDALQLSALRDRLAKAMETREKWLAIPIDRELLDEVVRVVDALIAAPAERDG